MEMKNIGFKYKIKMKLIKLYITKKIKILLLLNRKMSIKKINLHRQIKQMKISLV